MTLDPLFIISLIALGGFVGFAAGLLGVGGGGIMVPMLTTIFLWQGLDADSAVPLALGSSMAAIVATSFSSMRAHHRHGGVIWSVVLAMTPGIFVGAVLATSLVAVLDATALALIFSLFMFAVAVNMLLGAKPKPNRSLPSKLSLTATGSAIGGVSALVSIGGGTLSVPFLYWHSVDLKRAIGTSAGIGFPIAVSGTIGYLINGWGKIDDDPYVVGFIYLPAVIFISAISMLTAPLGVKLAYRLPVDTVKRIFAVLLFALSAKMLWSVL